MHDLYDLWARFKVSVADIRERRLIIYCILSLRSCHVMGQRYRTKQTIACTLIETYSGIARFPCDSTAFLLQYLHTTVFTHHIGSSCKQLILYISPMSVCCLFDLTSWWINVVMKNINFFSFYMHHNRWLGTKPDNADDRVSFLWFWFLSGRSQVHQLEHYDVIVGQCAHIATPDTRTLPASVTWVIS